MCEVLRSNFADTFPQIEAAIYGAEFFAIDTEFTGLAASPNDNGSLFDSGESRYQKLRHSVSQFTVTQIGLSLFVRDKSMQNTYVAHTFNFPLYPLSFGPYDTRFLCQASSWQFMCRYQFDFNKYVYEGLSFMNEEQEQVLLKFLAGHEYSDYADGVTDRRQLLECCSCVADWLVKAEDSDSMLIDVPDGLAEYSVIVELGARYPLAWAEYHSPGKVKVLKTSAENKQRLEEELKDAEATRVLNTMLGFTRVFRLLVKHKKPLLGHNNLMDLMFMYDKFYRPLPSNCKAFKAAIHELFPVVIDTKHIVSSLRQTYEEIGLMQENNLADLYISLDSAKGRLFAMCSPLIVHTEQHNRYKEKHCPHEAGYDAYMCGYVFLRIAHILASKGIKSVDAKPHSFRALMLAVAPFINYVNMIRASVDSMNLDGVDKPSRYPDWLYITSQCSTKLLSTAHLSRLFAPFGSVDIQVQDSRHAIVAARNSKTVKDIVKSLADYRHLRVTTYSYWRHSSTARTAAWTGVLVSSSVCLLALWSTMCKKSS